MKKINFGTKKLGTNPSFDWYFCLSCFAVGLAIVACVDFFLYQSLMTSVAPSVPAAAGGNTLNRADIESVAKILRASDAAGGAHPSIPDPSL
ncbi:MAG TPA: hypothetical protein VFT82_00135 [Candidatus Paceibacterota bacterium]|nr:hypothetical protein [Candidatus Paceibacterota bacterium]